MAKLIAAGKADSSIPAGKADSSVATAIAMSLTDIKAAAQKLNEVTDSAGTALREVESFLNTQNIGFDAHVRITPPDPTDPDGPAVFLSFARHVGMAGKFRLELAIMDGEDEISNKGWSECSRTDKLLMVKFVPALLKEVLKQLRERIREAETDVETVHSAMFQFDVLG